MTTTRRTERPAPEPEPAPATVHQAILAVMAEIGEQGIAKNGTNTHSNYKFRAIEDVLAAFNRAQVKHGLTIAHEKVEHETERVGKNTYVTVTMRYTLTGPDGSTSVQVYGGCGGDVGDKAMSKAQTNAYKYMLTSVFNIPVDGMADGDNDTPDRNEAEAQQQAEQLAAQRAHEQALKKLLATGARKGMDRDAVAEWFMKGHSEHTHPRAAHVQDLVMAEAELAKLPNAPQDKTQQGSKTRHPAGKRRPQQQTEQRGDWPDLLDPAKCSHPKGFTYADDGNGHEGSFCEMCGLSEDEWREQKGSGRGIPGQRPGD